MSDFDIIWSKCVELWNKLEIEGNLVLLSFSANTHYIYCFKDYSHKERELGELLAEGATPTEAARHLTKYLQKQVADKTSKMYRESTELTNLATDLIRQSLELLG